MEVPSDEGPENAGGTRPLLTRAQAAGLLGMGLCIASLFLTWPISMDMKLAVPAMVVNPLRTGPPPEVRWPVTGGAILAGLLLTFTPSTSARVPLAFVQALCGLVCLITALTHFSVQLGPVAALLGGALVTFGAVDRLGLTAGPSG